MSFVTSERPRTPDLLPAQNPDLEAFLTTFRQARRAPRPGKKTGPEFPLSYSYARHQVIERRNVALALGFEGEDGEPGRLAGKEFEAAVLGRIVRPVVVGVKTGISRHDRPTSQVFSKRFIREPEMDAFASYVWGKRNEKTIAEVREELGENHPLADLLHEPVVDLTEIKFYEWKRQEQKVVFDHASIDLKRI